jgi:hypothetical protein
LKESVDKERESINGVMAKVNTCVINGDRKVKGQSKGTKQRQRRLKLQRGR